MVLLTRYPTKYVIRYLGYRRSRPVSIKLFLKEPVLNDHLLPTEYYLITRWGDF